MSENCVFEVIVGTYEQFVLGYKFVNSDKGNKLLHSFATHSHQGTVKSVSVSSKWLASSSSDETIHLYDLTTRKECGQLMEQNGTITCICFTPDTSHLVSASEDGSIAIFRTGSWQMEKLWKSAHKGSGVTYVAVHPSGKLALSLGKDQTLRTWNLVKGRPAYTTNLSRCKAVLEFVVWSQNGDYYAVPMNTTLELFSVNTAGVTQVFKFKTKVTSAFFVNEKIVVVGEESGEVSSQCIETGLELWRFSGQKRVRGLAIHKRFLITGCSNGTVSVYSMSSPAEVPVLVTSAHTGCRVTCLTVHGENSKKRKTQLNKGESDTVIKRNGKLNFKETCSIEQAKGVSKNNTEQVKSDNINCIPRNQNWDVRKTKKVKR